MKVESDKFYVLKKDVNYRSPAGTLVTLAPVGRPYKFTPYNGNLEFINVDPNNFTMFVIREIEVDKYLRPLTELEEAVYSNHKEK